VATVVVSDRRTTRIPLAAEDSLVLSLRSGPFPFTQYVCFRASAGISRTSACFNALQADVAALPRIAPLRYFTRRVFNCIKKGGRRASGHVRQTTYGGRR
jgi:hypothetical protein